ncbi:efflux transporter outer membrane subunit [Paraburkholderia hospita]|uniref:efflux transporter outer membrane subunit n=1 Tax=Paraburkholderia hospita TaxID=169430 RepID=UPI0009A89189|nr:TolC family protein [Paraburkholderia hospita]SKC93344.1 efflux transporter, outer membrane factor (OMF) lipoprotein, NodT family [Paraburkholderia hospita]
MIRPVTVRAQIVAVVICAMLSGGCSLFHPMGPDYRRPAAQATFDASRSSAFSLESPPDRWWELYQDASLNHYVAIALRENRDLRAAASRLSIAQSLLDQVAAQQLPSTAVSASLERSRSTIPGELGLHVHNSVAVTLGASYEIDLFGRIRRSIEASQADVEEQQYTFAATQIQIVANTLRAYLNVCNANAALVATKRTIKIDRDTYAATRRLADGGGTSQLDVTRARAQLESDEATVPPLEAQRTAALYALATLLGRQPDQFPQEASQCTKPPTLERPIPTGDGLALLRRRPDVLQAERALASATANIGVTEASLYPQITVGLSIGSAASTIPNTLRAASRTWSIGPLLQWTFPNQAIARAQLREAGANADLAMSTYENTVLTALKETETALDSYARELDHLALVQRTRDSNQTAFDQANSLYRRGATSFLDLLSAQKSLALSEQQLVASAGSVATDQVSVFLALGGGWGDYAQHAAEQAKAATERRTSQSVLQ